MVWCLVKSWGSFTFNFHQLAPEQKTEAADKSKGKR
jgi:hypothetical protein